MEKKKTDEEADVRKERWAFNSSTCKFSSNLIVQIAIDSKYMDDSANIDSDKIAFPDDHVMRY